MMVVVLNAVAPLTLEGRGKEAKEPKHMRLAP